MKKKLWICHLCFVVLPFLINILCAQDKIEKKVPQQPKPKGLKIGSIVEDFSLRILDGGVFRLSDYKGKKIIVMESGAVT